MTTVTVSRQMGSDGYEASRLAASSLGYRLVNRELVNIAARRAGTPEMALAAVDELGLLNMCPDPAACQAFRDALAQVMHEFAVFGDVFIIGRAGQVILKDYPGVAHVRIFAPLPVRIRRIADRHQISLECARSRIQASDRCRKNYLKQFYQVRWDDPELYDLSLNTARLGVEETARLMVSFVQQRPPGFDQEHAAQPEKHASQLSSTA